jgi:hypothetical protein
MALLLNIDVPDVATGVCFYTQAFGLTVGRKDTAYGGIAMLVDPSAMAFACCSSTSGATTR